jgi:hypothetical protein
MSDESEPPIKIFHAMIFAGGSPDLLGLDLSHINMKFWKLKSDEFSKEIERLNDIETQYQANMQRFQDFPLSSSSHAESLYVVLPESVEQKYDEQQIAHVRTCLIMMFPSDFGIIGDIVFTRNINSNKYKGVMAITSRYRKNDIRKTPKYLSFGKSDLASVNDFIKHYIQNIKDYEYLSVAIQSYYNSFFQKEMRLCYVTLFICLESITSADSEITFQISRYCAVINSHTKDEGQIIFKKAKKLYNVRSRIVHGGDVSGDKIKSYYFHLEMLASRTLVELISHQIKTKELLFERINESGFGDKTNLSAGYKDYKICPDDENLLFEALPQ